jgi:hypothetical protein
MTGCLYCFCQTFSNTICNTYNSYLTLCRCIAHLGASLANNISLIIFLRIQRHAYLATMYHGLGMVGQGRRGTLAATKWAELEEHEGSLPQQNDSLAPPPQNVAMLQIAWHLSRTLFYIVFQHKEKYNWIKRCKKSLRQKRRLDIVISCCTQTTKKEKTTSADLAFPEKRRDKKPAVVALPVELRVKSKKAIIKFLCADENIHV